MKQMLPGTTVELDEKQDAGGYLEMLFSAGGLVLSQVLEITGQSSHTIQNWVKRGFVAPPENKKYDKDQLCSIILLNLYGTVFHLDEIKNIFDYVCKAGCTASCLYTTLLQVLMSLPPDAIAHATELDDLILDVLDKQTFDAELKQRLHEVLYIFLLAFLSLRLTRRARTRLEQLFG